MPTQDAFDFTASTTELTAANLNKIINSSGVNLVTNGSFELWDSTPVPMGWQKSGGGTLSQETNISYRKCGKYSAKISMIPSSIGYLQRYVVTSSFGKVLTKPGIRGKTFAVGAQVYCNASSSGIQVYMSDGVTTWSSTGHATGSTWERLTTYGTVASDADELAVGISFPSSTYSAWVDSVILCSGEIAYPFSHNFRDLTATDEDPDNHYLDQMHHAFIYDPYLSGTITSEATQNTSVSWTAFDVPTLTSDWCLDNARAVLLKVRVTDTVAHKNTYVRFREKGTSDTDSYQYVKPGQTADEDGWAQIWVGMDTGGEIEWWVNSGAAGATVGFEVYGVGYLKPI